MATTALPAPIAATTAAYAGRRRNELIAFAILLCAVAALPLAIRDVYTQNVIVLTLMYAALSQSWNILGGYCGQISLGHALYFGIGAYTTSLLYTKAGILPWFGMVAGGVIAAALALALGYQLFRLAGHYFAIATIVIAEAGLAPRAQLGLGRRRDRHPVALSGRTAGRPSSSAAASCPTSISRSASSPRPGSRPS